jgi:hypothetical protein
LTVTDLLVAFSPILLSIAMVIIAMLWMWLRWVLAWLLFAVLLSIVELFLPESTRMTCCGSGSPAKMGGRSAAKCRKREQRAQLTTTRADFRALFPPTQEAVESPSHARRRRRAQAIADLQQPHDVWIAGLLKYLAEIDEYTVRAEAEDVMRDLYLTSEQRRAHPHRLGKRS